MPGAGKKTASLSKTETESELISSFKLKKGSKRSLGSKGRPNSKSNFKTIGSILSKGKVTDSSSKRTKNDSANRKLISRKIVHKALETKSSKKRKNSSVDVKTKRMRKTKKNKQELELDEASRLQRRTRYLLIKMKLEQNLIDAYSADGWKGQSREKIKPEKELQRAKKQILKCKLGLRDAIHQLESLSSIGCIENSVIASDGSVHHEQVNTLPTQIFCAKCKLREAFPDNDIVLCDGTCNRAFHQRCLDPPLDTENTSLRKFLKTNHYWPVPPGDQGWFCKFCDYKMEVIDAMNAHIGTCYTVDTSWQDIFKEEAELPDVGNSLLNPDEDWPSDDSADVDYIPDRKVNNNSISGARTDDDDGSEGTSGSTSSSWSSDAKMYSGFDGMSYENHSLNSSAESGETSDGEIIQGRRQRRAVDYKKLYDEMFGKDAVAVEQISEDEDWSPSKKKKREKESDVVGTLGTLFEIEGKRPNVANREVKTKKGFSRIPPHAVEKLRQVFAENELPSRSVKENLLKELGLQPAKITKWFKNARYMALKIRKVEETEPPGSTVRIFEDSGSEHLEKRTGNAVPLVGNEKALETNSQSKDSSLFNSVLKKNRHITALAADSNKVLSDDVSLKKKLLNAKKVNVNVNGEAEAAMERLCRAKVRLENLQQRLSLVVRAKTKKSKKKLNKDDVIYVPIAELREKA